MEAEAMQYRMSRCMKGYIFPQNSQYVSQNCLCTCRGERQKLYGYIQDEARSEQLAQLQRAISTFAEVREELRCVYADGDLSVLKGAQVVGMTTNGVASKQELVAAMGSKVSGSALYHLLVSVHTEACTDLFACIQVHSVL